MKNNTVVTASDMNYLWGVFLLAASMRRNGMDEPIIVFGDRYTDRAKKILAQFGDIEVVDAPPSNRSMTCRKPEAMLLASTEYVSWVDCDAFFVDNCSVALTPPDVSQIRVRRRGEGEALAAKLSVVDAAGKTVIAPFMSGQWKIDVGELDSPRLNTCCSACYLSLATARKDFLERWRDHMLKFLPDGDVGVVDNRNPAYFQTDESALNALLCYMRSAPQVTAEYGLDRPETLFVHFISQPKPWVGWTRHSLRRSREYLSVVKYVRDRGYELPTPLPFALDEKFAALFPMLAPLVEFKRRAKNGLKKIRSKL